MRAWVLLLIVASGAAVAGECERAGDSVFASGFERVPLAAR